MKKICKQTITISIILLLIGVSVAPSTGNLIVINKLPCELVIDGPTLVIVGVPYIYILFFIDPDCNDVYFSIYWGDGKVEEWIGPYPSNENVSVIHVWYESGNYTIKAVAKGCDDSYCNATLNITIIDNQPPGPPAISYPFAKTKYGKVVEPIPFTFNAVDPDGDNVSYHIDWDDGKTEGWTDYYPSGQDITIVHTWDEVLCYSVRAKAKDEHGLIGPESTAPIYIIRNKDCDCQDVSKSDLIIVERLLNKVEVYNKFLLVLSRYIQDIKDICKKLSNEITKLNAMYQELKANNLFPENFILCIYLLIIYKSLYPISKILENIFEILQNYPFIYHLLYYIILPLYAIFFYIVDDALMWGEHYDCWWIDSQQSIYSYQKTIPFIL